MTTITYKTLIQKEKKEEKEKRKGNETPSDVNTEIRCAYASTIRITASTEQVAQKRA